MWTSCSNQWNVIVFTFLLSNKDLMKENYSCLWLPFGFIYIYIYIYIYICIYRFTSLASSFVSFKSTGNLKSCLKWSKIFLLIRVAGSAKYQNKKSHVSYNARESHYFQSIKLTTNFIVTISILCTYLPLGFVEAVCLSKSR